MQAYTQDTPFEPAKESETQEIYRPSFVSQNIRNEPYDVHMNESPIKTERPSLDFNSESILSVPEEFQPVF